MATGGESDLERGNYEVFDFLCSVCKRKNKITEARKFCTDCQEYFCSICVNSHNDFPALRNHQILDKAKFQPGSSVQFPMVPTERCIVHGHKPVDMYCRQHDAVGCPICMVMGHSACKDKFYIPDYIKNNKVDNPTTIAKELLTISSSLEKLQKTFLQEKKNIKSIKDKSVQEIKKFRLEINKRLDELEKTTVQDLERVCQSLTDKIEATLRELQAAITEVQSAQDNLKSADSNISQMFVSTKMANSLVSQVNEKVTATQLQVSSTDISFVPTQKLQSLFSELQALGSISISEKLESQPRSPAPLPPAATTNIKTTSPESQSSPSLLQIKGSNKYRVTEKSETRSLISSVCALDDGTIVLSYSDYDKLKLLESSTYNVRDSCVVPQWPCQICAISNQEVAVSCSSDQLIQFVSVGHTMQNTRQIITGVHCSGLAYADKKLFVSDELSSVYVYSITGDRLQEFSMPQLEDDGGIYLWKLAVSSDGSTIYVTHRTKGLIILDRNGRLVGEFTDSKLTHAYGVNLYRNNSILVSGYDSKNVVQFSSDGQLIGEVLKTDLGYAAICYCKKSSKLIVGFVEEIEVFNINE